MKHPKYYDTDEVTSRRMSNVKLKRGDAEIILAKMLWHKGYRYRLNYKKLPGSPDIAITKSKIAIFVDGEFWHGYNWDEKKSKLKRNRDYWIQKIEENMARDVRVDKQLLAMDWVPIHFWSKEIKKNPDECIQTIEEVIFEQMLKSDDESIE
ncbi:MAG: very short patch repair endonuclease [Lachnospiraceae bacterium]